MFFQRRGGRESEHKESKHEKQRPSWEFERKRLVLWSLFMTRERGGFFFFFVTRERGGLLHLFVLLWKCKKPINHYYYFIQT